MLKTLKQFQRATETDRLLTMVKESSNLRERNLEAMIRSGEEKSELYLEKHIRDQLRGRHKKLRETLTSDTLVDWLLLGALVFVGGFGALMWRKLKEQQSILL